MQRFCSGDNHFDWDKWQKPHRLRVGHSPAGSVFSIESQVADVGHKTTWSLIAMASILMIFFKAHLTLNSQVPAKWFGKLLELSADRK